MGLNNLDLKVTPRKAPVPAFDVGYRQNRVEVVEVLGWLKAYPDTGKPLTRGQHFYAVRCDCGTLQTVTQGSLIGGKRECRACEIKSKKARAKLAYCPKRALPEHLDFARLQLRGK